MPRFTILKFPTRKGRLRGFTLVEAMVIVVILGVLAAIAYPSYLNQVRKSKRVVAKSALLDAANRQERLFFERRAYGSDMTELGYETLMVSFDRNSAPTTVSGEAVYTVSVETINGSGCGVAPCYKLRAVPQGDQAKDACGTFTLTSSNARGVSTSTPVSQCW